MAASSKPKRLEPLRFEFDGPRRGTMARLVSGKASVTLVEWPASLYEMYDMKLLGPGAMAEVEGMRGA